MAYCKKFIAGISAINFSDSSAQLLKQALLSFAYKELQQELQAIKDRLARLPIKVDEHDLENEQLQTYRNVLGNEQLQAYKEKQAAAVARIEFQLSMLQEEAKNPPFDLDAEFKIDDSFIQNFAGNFRNIRHLADTLSDAPVAIKRLQTRLYTEILFKLEQKEQEVQLQTLSLEDIREMINQAFDIYEDESSTPLLRDLAKKLISMGIFEIIRSDCERATVKESLPPYAQYKEFLLLLNAKLPNVEKSNVIDTLSEHRDSQGRTLIELLFNVERKLGISPNDSWKDDAKIEAFKIKKAVFHKLRFGQSDRREYVERVQSNLARDLFWGRNIRDIELFTKSGVSDDEFSALVQQNSLKQSFRKPHSLPVDFSFAERKLVAVLNKVKEIRSSTTSFAIGDKTRVKGNDLVKMERVVSEEFKKFFVPTLQIKDGLIHVNFYYSSLKNNELTQSILEAKGLGSNSEPLVNELKKLQRFKHEIPAIQDLTLKGRTLAEIDQSLEQYFEEDFDKQFNKVKDVDQRNAYKKQLRDSYKKQLKSLQDTFDKEKIKQISDLPLSNNEEILLRKLLELQSIAPINEVTNGLEISEALEKIAANQYIEAVKIKNLESAVEMAYRNLASLREAEVPDYVRPILQKAKTLFTKEREEKLKTLNEILQSELSTTDKELKLTKLFFDEYKDMAPTLALSEKDYKRLHDNIFGMAKETIKLLERTQNAQPALKPEEEAAYFEAIKQISIEIESLNLKMNEVRFKIPYALKPEQKIIVIDKEGREHSVKIHLNVEQLPYSLIKPPGESEFIFSFGGSRGVIAPFAGLDKAYAGESKLKSRLFTHSRLLGVGQYGSVKEVENLLSGLNQVIKKGYVPSTEPTFSDESRNDLRTRPITARDDPFYRVESDILKNFSAAAIANKNTMIGETQYWLETDKQRSKGVLFAKDSQPQQYHLLTGRAKGQTFADKANEALNYYSKDKLAYHDPIQRKTNNLQELTDMLALSQALVGEAQKFATLGASEQSPEFGFAHNDIKPENFLYKRNSDGSFEVRYIDWATGGFERKYEGQQENLKDIFAELFGSDLSSECKEGVCVDKDGRFVRKKEGIGIVYGINPTLQILHGARSGTLPYLSPQKVLGSDRKNRALAAGTPPNPAFNTVLKTNDPALDDWALTAMTFGICNRQAYFALVKGRVVNDYIVTGILEPDDHIPLGLKIVDVKKFNEFFACGSELDSDSLKDGTAYHDPNAVMFIPSNQREGEPLHLYRRLQELKRVLTPLAAENMKDSPEQQIVDEIEEILQKVHRSIALGQGLSKQELQKELNAAQRCLKNYEKLNDKGYQEALQKKETLQTVLNEIPSGKPSRNLANELLQPAQEGGPSRLQVLTTYPESQEQIDKVINILQEAFTDEAELNDKFLSSEAPARHLFKEMIAQGQTDIFTSLVNKIADKKSAEETLSAITSQLEKINLESLELDEKIKQTRKEFVEEEERLTQVVETAKQEGEHAVSEAEVLLQETRKRHAMELERLRESQKVSQEKHKELIDIQSLELDEKIKQTRKEFVEEEERLTQAVETAKQEGEHAVSEAEVLLQETRERHAIELERLRKSQKVNQENQKALQDKFDKATKMRDDFVSLVREDGLLHYAAEQGLTEIFNSLVEALKRAEVDNILDLALAEYGPGKDQIHSALHLKWSTHCFHIAIRNNNKKQLETLLSLLPKDNRYDEVIAKALHFCAVLGNKTLFQAILDNRLELGSPLTTEQIMAIAFPPDNLSPYHLFLSNEANLTAIDWTALKQQPELAKDFLLSAPGNPLLIAAAKTNFAGVFQLLELGQEVQFNEWQQVFSQLDSQGKNILNYMLELDQFEYLDRFIHFIKENTENSADILVRLLSNPHPANPLKNFLSKQTNRDQHFAIVETLLDAICTDFSTATPEQQKARIVALLINKEWLIEQAKEPKNSSKLKVLLQNSALSIPFKQILFKVLKEAAQETEGARAFYEGLYKEVSKTSIELNKPSQLEISAVFNEAIRQTADFNMLFEALAEKHELAEKFELEVKELQSTVNAYVEEVKSLTAELEIQTKTVLKQEEELSSARASLEKSQQRASDLEAEIKRVNESHADEVSKLEAKLKKAGESGDEKVRVVREELEQTQKHHEEVLNKLGQSLKEATKDAEDVKSKLEVAEQTLASKLASLNKLQEQFQALERSNEALNEELSSAKASAEGQELKNTELVDEIQRLTEALQSKAEALDSLSSELKKQQETVSDLQQSLSTTQKSFEEAERRSSALEKQLEQLKAAHISEQETYTREKKRLEEELSSAKATVDSLGSKNEALEQEAGNLKDKVNAYVEEVKSLTADLEIQTKTVLKQEEELSSARASLEKSQQRSSVLEAEIKRVNESHADEVSRLEAKLKKAGESGDEKVRVVREELEQTQKHHEEVLNKLGQSLKEATKDAEDVKSKLEVAEQTLASKLASLNKLQEQFQALERSNEALNEELSSAKASAEGQELKNTELVDEIQRLTEALQSKAEALDSLSSELKKQQETVSDLQQSLSTTQKSFEEAERRSSALEKQLEQLKAAHISEQETYTREKKRLEEELSSAKATVDSLGSKNEALEQEAGDLKDKVNAYVEEVKSLTADLEIQTKTVLKQEEELSSARASLEKSQQRSSVLEAEIKRVNESHADEVSRLEAKLKKAGESGDEKVRVVREELEQTQKHHEEVLNKLGQSLKEATKDAEDVKSKLEVAEQTLASKLASLNKLQEQFQALERSNEALNEELSSAKASAEGQELKNTELVDEIQRLTEALQSKAEALDSLSSELKKQQETVSDLQQSLSTTQKSFEEAERRSSALEKQLEQLKAAHISEQETYTREKKRLEEELSSAKATVNSLGSKNEALEKEAGDLKDKVNAYVEEVKSLTADLEIQTKTVLKQEEELSSARASLEKSQQRSSVLEAEIKRVNESHADEVSRLEAELKKAGESGDEQVRVVREELEQTQKRHEEVLNKLNQSLKEAMKDTEEVRSKLEVAEQTLASNLASLKELQEQFQALKRSNEALTEELSSAKASAEGQELKNTELVDEIQRLTEALQSKAEALDSLSSELKKQQETVSDLQQSLSTTQKSFEEAERRSSALEKQLEQLKAAHISEQETYTREKKRLEEELSSAKATVDSLGSKNEALEQEAGNLKDKVNAYVEEVKSLTADLEIQTKTVLKQEEELSSARASLEKSQQRSSVLEAEIKRVNESHADEVSRLEAELKKAGESGDEQVRVVREELEQTQKRHEEVLNKLNQSLKEAMKDTEEVRSKLEVAEQTLASNLASLKELQEQFQVLKRSNEALTEELSSAKASAEGQELKNTELVDEIQRLTEALQSKAEALDSLSSELKKQQETVSDLQQSLSTTQKSFEEAERRSSALEKQLEQLNVKHSKEKIDLETKLSTATEKVDAVQKQLEEEQRKSLESEKKQKEAEKIAEEALKEVAAMRLESKRLQEEMEKLRRETKERQSQLDAREHQLEERANQLNTRESLLEQREMQLEARENELEEHRREVALAEEEVHPRETDLVELLPIIENPREVARRRAITALNAQLANSFDDALLITISEAESNEDLAKAGLKLKYLRALNADDFELIADTAENRLTELQELRSENKKKLLGNNYKIVLGENREKLRGIHTNLNKIATLDSGTRKELDYLVRVSPLHWFSPAFQASLKKNARDLAPHYERLAEGCDVIVDYLKPLSIELKHQLNSLPSMEQMQRLPENSPQRLEIEDRRALLTRYLQRVQKELDLYEPLYKLLNGDPTASNPLLRQGIRKTLRYAQDEKYALKFLDFATDYHDFAQSEKAAHFENDYEADSEAEATVLSGNLGSSRYSVIEAVKHGYFREHVVNPDDPLCGYFIEERAKSLDNRLDKRSLKGYRPQITITVSKFPQGDNHDPAVIAARVKYSLAVATQFLAEFVEPPSEANPLTLRGPNPEELRYLWTALVLVGKEVPEFQFSHKAVEVASAAFMPKKEREAAGFWGRATQWTANSCYNTCFKGQPSLDLWLTGLKEASKHRTHFKKESEQIKKVVGEVTHTFFGNPKAKTIIDELKQEIKADPKAGG